MTDCRHCSYQSISFTLSTSLHNSFTSTVTSLFWICYLFWNSNKWLQLPLLIKKTEKTISQLELQSCEKGNRTPVFAELIDCLESRKKHLFDQLNDILIRYQSYKRETDELSKQKSSIGKTVTPESRSVFWFC